MNNFCKFLLLAAMALPFTYAGAQGTKTTVTYTSTPWSSATSYVLNEMVTYSGVTYISVIANNLNNTPSSSPSDWQPIGGAVTASAMQSATSGLAGCTVNGYAWNPATNTCTASGTPNWAVPGAIGSTTPNTGAFTTITATTSITALGDGVHAGILSLVGNTTNPSIPANQYGWLGYGSASAPALFFQPTTTSPTSGQHMVFSSPSGNVSQQTWATSYGHCDIPINDTSGSAITSGQMGPQSRVCFIPSTSTLVEMDVNADAGTPSIIVGRNHAGTIANITSSALATAASGGIACSNTGGTTGLNGVTTCSNTLQNTSLSAGDYLELVSGTPGGTAKFFVVHITYAVN